MSLFLKAGADTNFDFDNKFNSNSKLVSTSQFKTGGVEIQQPKMQKIYADSIYEIILENRNFYKKDTEAASNLVKNFVLRKKYTLYGGMSIDMALRLKGTQLYPDSALPDYDFYTPTLHLDAYDIAIDLEEKDFKHISAINAAHQSTMRVFVQFQSVADLTYIPDNILKKMPVLKYEGFKIAHPHYQMIDQHKSLSRPYDNPPKENILHRLKKDMTRFDLIIKFYPFSEPTINLTKENKTQQTYDFSLNIIKGECLSGFVALGYWINQYNLMKLKMIDLRGLKFETRLTKVNTLIVSLPEHCEGLTIYSDWPKSMRNKILKINKINNFKVKYYNSIFGKTSKKILVESDSKGHLQNSKFEIYDNQGSQIGAHLINSKFNIRIANLQVLMVEFLTKYIFEEDPISSTNLAAYLICYDIIVEVSSAYALKASDILARFLPTTEVFGENNWNDIYKSHRRKFLEKLKVIPRSAFPEVPPRLYPDKNNSIKNALEDLKNNDYGNFDINKSHIFQQDGMEIKEEEFIENVLHGSSEL
jgi:hypothetical protein